MKWVAEHWEILAFTAPVIVDVINKTTKHWTERKTRFGRALAWFVEVINIVSFRKPNV